jgi:AbrB family looped-hinge helix DNA binding protein
MSLSVAIVCNKGRITLPQAVRHTLVLQQGDPVLFEEKDGVVLPRKRPKNDAHWAAGLAMTLGEALIHGVRGHFAEDA